MLWAHSGDFGQALLSQSTAMYCARPLLAVINEPKAASRSWQYEGYAVQRPISRFWGESEDLALTLFTASDFIEFNMEPDGLNGVQAKAFVRDQDDIAWLLKSGALGDTGSTRPSPDEERTRRAAFPVHEAIVAMLMKGVGVSAGDVDFAFRTLLPVDEPGPLRLLVSAHRLVHGRRCDKAGDFQPSATFTDDLFVALCVNLVIGQRDLERHNYLVGDDGRFVPIDNSGCMYGDWLSTDLVLRQFDDIESLEPLARTWTDELRERVQRRLEPLTPGVVGTVFAALPPDAVAWHDTAAGIGYYAPGTLAQKEVRIWKNVEVLRRWAGHEQ